MHRALLTVAATLAILVAGAPAATAAAETIDPACSSGLTDGALPVTSSLAPLPALRPRTPIWPAVNGRMPVGIALQPLPGTAVDLAAHARFITPQPYVRLQIAVNLIWPAPDRPLCLATADRDYRELVARDVRPLLLPAGLPSWMAAGRIGGACTVHSYCTSPPREEAIDAHARLFAVLAERYPLAAGLEAPNEANLKQFSGGIAPDPELYARGMIAAHDAVEAANPRMRFLGLSVAPVAVAEGGNLTEKTFLDRALAVPGATRAFDAVSVHPYPGSNSPRYLGAVDAALRRAGVPDARLVVTETGVAGGQASAGHRLLAEFDRLRPGGSLPGAGRVDGYLIFSGHQSAARSLNQFDIGSFLFWTWWQPRPSACALRQRFVGTSSCPTLPRAPAPSSPR